MKAPLQHPALAYLQKAPWVRWALLGVVGILVVVRALKGGDMDAFLDAARRLREGENPYLPPFWGNMPFVYGPFWAWVLVPFTWLPNAVLNGLWLSLSLWMLVRLYRLLTELLPDRYRAMVGDWRFQLVFALLIARFVFYNFVMIQLTIFLTWVVFEAERLFRQRRTLAGGVMLGASIVIKLLPLLVLPWLVARGRWAAAAATVGAIGLCLLLPATTLGWQRNLDLLTSWVSAANPDRSIHVFEVEASTHGLPSLVPALFHQLPGADLPYRRHLAELGPEAAYWALRIAQMLCLGCLGLVLLRPFLRPRPGYVLYELALVCLLIPLVAPHQQKYAFFFCYPVVWGLLVLAWNAWPRRPFWPWLGLAAWFVGTFLSQDLLIGRPLNMITQHYKTITWAAVILVPAWLVGGRRLASRQAEEGTLP